MSYEISARSSRHGIVRGDYSRSRAFSTARRAPVRQQFVVMNRRRLPSMGETAVGRTGRGASSTDSLLAEPSAFAQHVNEQVERLAKRDSASFAEGAKIKGSVLIRLLRALHRISSPNTVFPNISPDGEGGVSATWFAGRYAVELSCSPTMLLEFRRQDESGLVQFNLELENVSSMSSAKEEINRLSDYVHHMNPGWRKTIRKV